jgi:hypothetical protein
MSKAIDDRIDAMIDHAYKVRLLGSLTIGLAALFLIFRMSKRWS